MEVLSPTSKTPPPINDKLLKENISRILQWKPVVGPTPRIAIFGRSGSGKSSLINSLSWVSKYEKNGAFVMDVPCNRIRSMQGGANTMRLRLIEIGNMELIDTRGFKLGAHSLAEIKCVCTGKRNFITDMSWEEEDEQNVISEAFAVPCKRVDFVIFVVSAVNLEYQECRTVIKAIKAASGCIPVIIVTHKDQVDVGKQAEIHTQLIGMGASSAFFVKNYLIDREGNYPTENDLDIQTHTGLCDAVLYVQHEYDQHIKAIKESRTTFLAKLKILVKIWLTFLLIISIIALMCMCMSWYYGTRFWENLGKPLKIIFKSILKYGVSYTEKFEL